EAEAAVVLVRGRDHAERLSRAALGEAGPGGFGERPLEQPLDSKQPVSGERQRAVGAGLAYRPSRLGRVAGEAGLRAALGTARHVRQIAGQPEQLQLEREHEWVDAGRVLGRPDPVEEVEE